MIRGMIVGALVWLLARIFFRFTGQWFLDSEPFVLLFGFTWMTVSSALAVWFVVRWFCPSRDQLWPFGIGLVVPGLFGDAIITMFFGLIYPNIGGYMAAGYGSWMLWGYGVIMASLLLFGERAVKDHAG
jgi:hypothetical protein